MTRTLSLIPEDNAATIEQARTWASWLQDWINRDFGHAWSQGAYVVNAMPTSPTPSAYEWVCHLRNATPSDPAGAGGYHTLDAKGNPVIHILMDRLTAVGYPVTVVLAHEAAETAINRWVNGGVRGQYNGQACYYQIEVGDPFEADAPYDHAHGSIVLPACNYALPAYFAENVGGGPYDRLGHGKAPFTPSPGGRQYLELVTGGGTISGAISGDTFAPITGGSAVHLAVPHIA